MITAILIIQSVLILYLSIISHHHTVKLKEFIGHVNNIYRDIKSIEDEQQ